MLTKLLSFRPLWSLRKSDQLPVKSYKMSTFVFQSRVSAACLVVVATTAVSCPTRQRAPAVSAGVTSTRTDTTSLSMPPRGWGTTPSVATRGGSAGAPGATRCSRLSPGSTATCPCASRRLPACKHRCPRHPQGRTRAAGKLQRCSYKFPVREVS